MKRSSFAVAVVIIAAPGLCPGGTPQLGPLPLEEALATKSVALFTDIAVSPDGGQVAYTIQDHGHADRPIHGVNGNVYTDTGVYLGCYGCDVYVTDLDSGRTRNVSGSVGSSGYAAWSPDSKFLAFYSDRDGQMRVWIWERVTGNLRRVSEALALPDVPLPPLWADGGRSLIVSLLPEGTSFAEINRGVSAQAHPARTRPGSTVTVYAHEREQDGPSPATRKLQGYDGFSTPAPKDLARIDVTTGRHVRLFPDFRGRFLGLSADGRYALATLAGGVDEHDYNDSLFTLLVVEVASGRTVMSIADVPMLWGTAASWAPSGHRFAYITGYRSELQVGPSGKSGRRARRGDVFVAQVGGEPVNVSEGEHPSFTTGDRPVWSADGRAVYLMADGRVWRADVDARGTRPVTGADAQRRILKLAAVNGRRVLWQPKGSGVLFVQASRTDTLNEEICAVDIGSGAITPVMKDPWSYQTGVSSALLFDAARSDAPAVFGAQSATEPADLYLTEDFGAVRRLTRLNPVFGQYVMGRTRLIAWTGKDGRTYKGTLLLPAGYEESRRYPMVVWQRPSNVGSMALNVFGLLPFQNYQILATRGYAVFYPDFPARNSREVAQVARDVVFPGIDRVVELGIADPDRIGLAGLSWGGYSTYVLITLTDRFKAAVAESGPSNTFDSFSVMLRNGAAVRVQESINDIGGTPWTARQAYIDTSPFFHLDKVVTPLMIVHSRGDDDYSIPQAHANQVFVGLRHLNRTVQMLIYHGGHGFSSASFVDQVEIWSRIIDWYGRFLGQDR